MLVVVVSMVVVVVACYWNELSEVLILWALVVGIANGRNGNDGRAPCSCRYAVRVECPMVASVDIINTATNIRDWLNLDIRYERRLTERRGALSLIREAFTNLWVKLQPISPKAKLINFKWSGANKVETSEAKLLPNCYWWGGEQKHIMERQFRMKNRCTKSLDIWKIH